MFDLPLDLLQQVLYFILKDDTPPLVPIQPASSFSSVLPADPMEVDSSEYEDEDEDEEDDQTGGVGVIEQAHGQTLHVSSSLMDGVMACIDKYQSVAALFASSPQMRELLVNQHDTFWNWLVQSLSGDTKLAVAVALRWFSKPFCEARHLISGCDRGGVVVSNDDDGEVYLVCVILRNNALMTRSMMQSFSDKNVATIIKACMETPAFELAVESNCKESVFIVMQYFENLVLSMYDPRTTETVRRGLDDLLRRGIITPEKRVALGGISQRHCDHFNVNLLYRLARVACVSGNEAMMDMILNFTDRATTRRDANTSFGVNSMRTDMYKNVNHSIKIWNEEGQKAARSPDVVNACLDQAKPSEVVHVLLNKTFPLPAHKRPAYHDIALRRGYFGVEYFLKKFCIKKLAKFPHVVPEIVDALTRAIDDSDTEVLWIGNGNIAASIMYVIIRFLPNGEGNDLLHRVMRFLKYDNISRSTAFQKEFKNEFDKRANDDDIYLLPSWRIDPVSLAISNGRVDVLRDLLTAEPEILYYSNTSNTALQLLQLFFPRKSIHKQGREICQVLLDVFRETHEQRRAHDENATRMSCSPYLDLLRVIKYVPVKDREQCVFAPVLMCMYFEDYLTCDDISASDMFDACFPFLSGVCTEKYSRLPFPIVTVAICEKENAQGHLPLLQLILDDPRIPVDATFPAHNHTHEHQEDTEWDTVMSCLMGYIKGHTEYTKHKGVRALLRCPRIDCSVRLNRRGETVLHKLTTYTDEMGLAILNEKGEHAVEAFKIKDTEGRSVLISLASQTGRDYDQESSPTEALLRALILDKHCVDVNAKDNVGRTALMHAAMTGHFAFANILFDIANKYDGDDSIHLDVFARTTDVFEDTALHLAVKYCVIINQSRSWMYLITEYEIDNIIHFFEWMVPAVGFEGLNLRNGAGHTPLSIALDIPLKHAYHYNHYTNRIIRLLLQNGAQV